MSISNLFKNITQYLAEAFARIFGPAEEDTPPEIGVQPFDSNLYFERRNGEV